MVNHSDFPLYNLTSAMDSLMPAPARELVSRIGNLADTGGYSVFLAGGFIRDLLLGIHNIDLDLVVEGEGISFASLLADEFQSAIICHDAFQTAVLSLPDGSKIDVATARIESYASPGLLPQVQAATLQEDLFRRDFTVNAMAMGLNRTNFGLLYDLYGGQKDLTDKKIRILHHQSFVEDPTRIIRGLRFSVRYGFSMEEVTQRLAIDALQNNLLERLSPARLREEAVAVFNEREPYAVIRELVRWGAWPFLFPEIPPGEIFWDALGKISMVISRTVEFLPNIDRVLLHLMVLSASLPVEEIGSMIRRLQFPGRYAREISRAVVRRKEQLLAAERSSGASGKSTADWSLPGTWDEVLDGLTVEGIPFIMVYADSQTKKWILDYLIARQKTHLSIDGRDLLAMGMAPGPRIRQIIRQVYQARLNGAPGSRETEAALAQKYLDSES